MLTKHQSGNTEVCCHSVTRKDILNNFSEKPWNSRRNNWDLGKWPRHPDHRSGRTCTTTLRGENSALVFRIFRPAPPENFPRSQKKRTASTSILFARTLFPPAISCECWSCYQFWCDIKPRLRYTIVFAEALGLTAIYHSSCTGNESHWGHLKNLLQNWGPCISPSMMCKGEYLLPRFTLLVTCKLQTKAGQPNQSFQPFLSTLQGFLSSIPA